MSNLGPFQFKFEVDDKVKFDLGAEGLKGTGTILGQSVSGIVNIWIVMLDEPINGEKAATIPGPLLELISRSEGT